MTVAIPQHLVERLAARMTQRLGLLGGLRMIGTRAARPHPLWIAAGAIWGVYEIAMMEAELDVSRMEANIREDRWEATCMDVFARISATD